MSGENLSEYRTEDDAGQLVDLIMREERLPIVVVSLPEGETTPRWDVDALARRLDG